MKKREIVKAVLFVAAIILVTAACNKKDDGPTLDFDIEVPADWKYYVLNEGNEQMKVVYYAQSPTISLSDSVTEDLIITKNSAPGMSLSSFYTAYLADLDDDTTYHYISTVDTSINDVDAIKFTHLLTIYAVNTANNDTVHLNAKLQKYIMMNNNSGYVVSFNALTDTFDDYQEIFDNIISTFVFKK
jgi:hypothetical protein